MTLTTHPSPSSPRTNGFSGTIAAAVVQSIPPAGFRGASATLDVPALFVLSAKRPAALREYIQSYIGFLSRSSPADFHSICYTSCIGREHYSTSRFACVASSLPDLIGKLKARLEMDSHHNNIPAVVLAFPGQGLHYQGMGSLCLFSGFRTILEHNSKVAERITTFPVFEYLTTEAQDDLAFPNESSNSQLATFIYQVSVAQWLTNLGLPVSMVVGHSMGEIAASGILHSTLHVCLD